MERLKQIEKIEQYAEKMDIPIIQNQGLKFLLKHIQQYKVRSILEIGTAIGYSSIMMAHQDKHIRIDTIEIDPVRYEVALENIKKLDLQDQIKVHFIDAIQFQSEKGYDLIFIDGPKVQYERHMRHFFNNLNKDGAFIIDNLEFHGLVDNPDRTKNRRTKSLIRKLKEFRDKMIESNEFDVQYYKTIGDGIMLIRRKDNNA